MDVRTDPPRNDARRWPLRAFGYLAALPVALFCLAVAFCYGLYWQGLADIPAELPQARRTYPTELRRLYWRAHDGQGEIRVPRSSSPRLASELLRIAASSQARPPRPSAAWQVLSQSARVMLAELEPAPGLNLRRHQTELSLQILLSRERSGEQLIDYLLDRSYFGQDAAHRPIHGIEAAASHYYGLPVERLTAAEQLALLVLSRNPYYFDPACNPERFRRRYAFLLGRVGLVSATTAEHAPPPRMRVYVCTRNAPDNEVAPGARAIGTLAESRARSLALADRAPEAQPQAR